MPAKSAKARLSGRSGGYGGASFLCACGAIVLESDRSGHACGFNIKGKSKPKAALGAIPSASSVGLSGSNGGAEDVKEMKRVKLAKPTANVPFSELLQLRTHNWSLKFGSGGELLISLWKRGPDGKPMAVEAPVIDDPQLPIHTYRFEMNGKHYLFEYFL
jgi:hypothetical protein